MQNVTLPKGSENRKTPIFTDVSQKKRKNMILFSQWEPMVTSRYERFPFAGQSKTNQYFDIQPSISIKLQISTSVIKCSIMYIYLFQYVYLSIYLSIHLSLTLFIYLSIYLSIYTLPPSILHQSIYLSIKGQSKENNQSWLDWSLLLLQWNQCKYVKDASIQSTIIFMYL